MHHANQMKPLCGEEAVTCDTNGLALMVPLDSSEASTFARLHTQPSERPANGTQGRPKMRSRFVQPFHVDPRRKSYTLPR